jgi:RNA polymerase subunit RPABC4/transcription elongation factor Spt4
VAEFESTVTTITTDVVSLAYVCVLYWAVVPSLGSMLWIILLASWPMRVIQVGVIVIVIILSIRLWKHAAPLVAKAADALADRATEATLATTMVVCPKCHTQNEKGNKFCRSCGGQITQATRMPEKIRVVVKCPKCGAILERGSKFCGSCGRDLSASNT